jgi:HSP20 family protein
MYNQMTLASGMEGKGVYPWNRSNGAGRYFPENNPFMAFHGHMNRLFNEFLHDFDHSPIFGSNASTRWPNIEVSETEKDIKVLAELPGIDEKDVSVDLRDGVLTLKGEQKRDSNGSGYSERSHGKFERSIQLGSEIDPEKATTSFKHGVLTIAFAKRLDAKKQVKHILVGRESTARVA